MPTTTFIHTTFPSTVLAERRRRAARRRRIALALALAGPTTPQEH
jgi:hypothetical protein